MQKKHYLNWISFSFSTHVLSFTSFCGPSSWDVDSKAFQNTFAFPSTMTTVVQVFVRSFIHRVDRSLSQPILTETLNLEAISLNWMELLNGKRRKIQLVQRLLRSDKKLHSNLFAHEHPSRLIISWSRKNNKTFN